MNRGILCKKCQQEIAEDKRADALYCSRDCRLAARMQEVKRRNSDRLKYERELPQQFAAWLDFFERKLRQQAPENAIGYRAGLWSGHDYLWFPVVPSGTDARGKLRTRLDLNRRRTTSEYFRLQPFEPPCVPLATLYQIRFISNVYPYPDLDEDGTFEEAIPYGIKIRALPIENLASLPVRKQRK